MLVDKVQRAFSELQDAPCWNVRCSDWSNLRLNFGTPWLSVSEPAIKWDGVAPYRSRHKRLVAIRGQWLLWIYGGYWALLLGDKLLARSSSSDKAKARGAAILNGQKLTSVEIRDDIFSTRFRFDLGCTLNVRRMEVGASLPSWMLYRPNGYVLELNCDGTVNHKKSAKLRPDADQQDRT
jgi:hypothetical protein